MLQDLSRFYVLSHTPSLTHIVKNPTDTKYLGKWKFKTYSRAVVKIQSKLCDTGVKQPTAVQLALEVCLGFVFQHAPSRV